MELQNAFDHACGLAHDVPLAWSRASPGDQLRVMRSSRRVSQRHLAAESGVSQAIISRLERGADARLATWQRLFTALGFDAILLPRPSCEDAEDLIKDENERRKDRAAAGRALRW